VRSLNLVVRGRLKVLPIRTARLDLVPMTPEFLRASLRHDVAAASEAIGLRLPTDWPDIDHVLALRLEQLDLDPTLQPWLLRAMALRSGEMVGHIGFHTSPGAQYLEPWRPGGVEFGFTVFAPHRRKGYAREASLALMAWAHGKRGVKDFVLTISPDNLPSQRLAAGLGFSRIGEHFDEVDGLEHILAKTFSGAA
jgi:ribosomal-protein-alanine N-acetyltransferase